MSSNNNDDLLNEVNSGESVEEEDVSVYSFPTSNGPISFSLRTPPRRNIAPMNSIINSNLFNNPLITYFPLNGPLTTLGGGGATPDNILNNSLYDKNAYKYVLSDEGREQINYRKFNIETDEIKKCPIMIYNFEDGEEIAELPCKHIFNKEAIENWLDNEDASCPVCRKKLDSKEIKNEDEEEEYNEPVAEIPNITELFRSYRQRSMAIIDNAEERMMQMAIEESFRD